MEANPPSYGQATAVNVFDLVAEFLSSSDLCSVALVCQEWHSIFVPHLWGNPASHFGDENDRVYVALTRFKRALPWARRSVRSLTHTLHLPPAHAEIYNGPHSDWLREVLEGLPNLQSLVVRGLPFFDHTALHALKFTRSPGNWNTLVPSQMPFGLRLLDASRCGNVTSSGLQQALLRFDSLLYLDLSWTYPAKDSKVLQTIGHFSGLQILKLRGMSLRDDDVRILAKAIKTRVRSLDVRNNFLTDRSVRVLLDECFTPPPQRNNDGQVSSPSLLPYVGAEMLSIYRGHQFEAYIRNEFASKFVGRLAIEDAPESGITHLYISDNLLTVEGLSGLIRSGRLHVFDAGTLQHDLARHPSLGHDGDLMFPGKEKLIPVLAESASHSLTYLRIDHSLITKQPANCTDEEILPGRSELPTTSDESPVRAELDSENEVFEMLGDTSFPNELPGDPIHIVITPTADKHEGGFDPYAGFEVRRGSSDAPMPVQNEIDDGGTLHVSSIEQEDDRAQAARTAIPKIPFRGRERSYSSVVGERKSRLRTHLAQSRGFHPGVLPHLHTLVLTEVPPFAPDMKSSDRLIAFVRECAEETKLARLQAQLDWTMPPGRKASLTYRQQQSRKSFALEQIALEVASEKKNKGKNKPVKAWIHHGTKSLTQDQDSEALWSAAETDFSFFDEGESASLSWSLEPERPPLTIMSGMEVVAGPPTHQQSYQAQERRQVSIAPDAPQVDVVSEIARFRKAKKSAYENRVAMGDEEPEVDGFWEGNIKVIRKARDTDPKREDDEVWADFYGNRFSNGYLYR